MSLLSERTTELLLMLASDLEETAMVKKLHLPTLEGLQGDELTEVATQAARIINGFLEAGEDAKHAVLRAGR